MNSLLTGVYFCRPKDTKAYRKLSFLTSAATPEGRPLQVSCTFPETHQSPIPSASIHFHPHAQSSNSKPKCHQRSLSDAPFTIGVESSVAGSVGPVGQVGTGSSSTIAYFGGPRNSNSLGHRRIGSSGLPKNCLGDLTSGHCFDNGCICYLPGFDGTGSHQDCTCGVSCLTIPDDCHDRLKLSINVIYGFHLGSSVGSTARVHEVSYSNWEESLQNVKQRR